MVLTDQAKLSLLRHLAERVMGGEIVGDGNAVRFTLPSRDGWERAATLRLNSPGGFNPLEDANAALKVLSQLDITATLIFTTEEWDVTIGAGWRVNNGHGTFCEAICLAAAKATGWEKT